MSLGAEAGEFSLAHVVAFQHTILHPIPGGNGIHDVGTGDASTISPRKSAHTFHSRWPKEMMHTCHSRCWNHSRCIFLLAIVPLLSALAEPHSNGYDPARRQTAADAVNIASWETQDLPNFRIRLKLPPGYKQKHWAVVIGSPDVTTFQRGHENEIDFTIENVGEANPENAKVIAEKDYVDYKKWSQLIGGHKGVVQTFQGGGVVIDEGGKRLPHQVEVTCAVDEKHILRISAMLGNREQQEEVLTMLKTVEFY